VSGDANIVADALSRIEEITSPTVVSSSELAVSSKLFLLMKKKQFTVMFPETPYVLLYRILCERKYTICIMNQHTTMHAQQLKPSKEDSSGQQ
jgi:hypothetical protein